VVSKLGYWVTLRQNIEVEDKVSERVNSRRIGPTPPFGDVYLHLSPTLGGYFKQRDNLNHSPPVDGGGGHAV
jgi:hypothetical protein